MTASVPWSNNGLKEKFTQNKNTPDREYDVVMNRNWFLIPTCDRFA